MLCVLPWPSCHRSFILSARLSMYCVHTCCNSIYCVHTCSIFSFFSIWSLTSADTVSLIKPIRPPVYPTPGPWRSCDFRQPNIRRIEFEWLSVFRFGWNIPVVAAIYSKWVQIYLHGSISAGKQVKQSFAKMKQNEDVNFIRVVLAGGNCIFIVLLFE